MYSPLLKKKNVTCLAMMNLERVPFALQEPYKGVYSVLLC